MTTTNNSNFPPVIQNTNEPNTSLISINISAQAPLKLTTANYISWKLQFHTLFVSYDLLGYIDGSKPCPPSTITQNNTTVPNPAHNTWIRQDQLILNALVGSLSPTIIPFIARAKTSAKAWLILENTYAKPSRGRIKQVKNQIKNLTKGSQTVTKFLQLVKCRANELAILGAPMNEDDLIDKILDGLGDDYKEIIRAVQARDTMIMFDELHEKLLNFEASFQGAKSEPSHFLASANPANHNTTSWRPSFNSGNTSNNWHPSTHSGNNRTDWRPSTNTNNQRPLSRAYLGYCQIYGIQRHTANRCPSFRLVPNQPNTAPVALVNNTLSPWQPRAHFAANTTPTTPQWLLDSGASHHVTADLSNLFLYTPYTVSDDIMIGDGSSLPITHTGSTSFTTHNTSFKLDNVLCVPSMRKNLISISQFCTSNNVSVEFLPSSFHVKELRTGAILLKGHTKDGVYEWSVSSSPTAPSVAFSSVKTSSSEWHRRLGHHAFPILKHIVSHYQLDLFSSLISDFLRNACHCNKSHKLPFSTSTIVSSQPLEIIFFDVWTSPVISHNGFKYYVIFVDHFTKYIWFYPLQQKFEVKTVFIRLKALVETQFQKKIHTLYSDNGGEYLALRTFLTTHGITHLTTPPHTLEHNGYFERRHHHIVETGLTFLSHASLPLTFWTHAFATAVYLINRMPTSTLNLSSPYENIFGSPPNYSKLRIFGCLCYPWLRPYSSHKLESRSKPCIFLGYSLTQSDYLYYHPPTSRMYVSLHVKFVESVFSSLPLSMPSACPQLDTTSTWIPPIITVPTNQASTGTFNTPSAVQPQGQLSCDASFPATNTTPHISHESTIHPTISLPSPEIQPTTSMLSPNTQPNTSISVPNTTSQPPPPHLMTTRAKNNI
ncbi:hypothetical protein VitviT2T_020169 [Vitis vinifera]|uniref:Integrase catalytic domain-containing protein n=1 Tax=Vitis vinifera TaxID=29760 RepID=A0ABY9D559_VITVI|nr:hypothetical protein VitviT2T_020169 [Vitis vinifera]